MNPAFTIRPPRLAASAAVAAGLCLAAAAVWGRAWGQDSAEPVEVRELRAALGVAQAQAEAQRARADEAEAQRRALVASLAEAVRVSEEQMTAARETELKLQALGVDLISRDENALEQRLLKAVRDLDIAQQEIERRGEVIRRLSESQLKLLKSDGAIDEGDRTRAEAALAAANEALSAAGAGATETSDLSAARVVSIDSSIGLVVFDAGRRSGLRVGTPVAVLRGERPIYSALIVDVREAIAGAVLQDRMGDAAAAGEVEIGDGIRLLPEQNPL